MLPGQAVLLWWLESLILSTRFAPAGVPLSDMEPLMMIFITFTLLSAINPGSFQEAYWHSGKESWGSNEYSSPC